MSAPITLHAIVDLVAAEFCITARDILGPHRLPEYVLPRQVAAYLAKNHTKLSLPQIAERLGGRDHATIIHAIRVVEGRKNGSHELRSSVAKLERQLTGVAGPQRAVGLSPEIFAAVQQYARRHTLRVDTAANELLRYAAGVDA